MKVTEKLDSFAKTAFREAESKSAKIEEELDEMYERECEKIYNEALKESKEKIAEEKQKLDNQKNKDIMESSKNSRLSVIDMRNQLIADIFKNVTAKITDYAETEEYFDRLCADMKEVYEKYGEVEFFLCERDMFLKDKILAKMKDAIITLSDTDIFGGFKARVIKGNLLIDYSFSSRLEEERLNFKGFRIS